MEHERPVWFLDVDGVVSPFGVQGEWDGPTLYSQRYGDLAVPYRREVVDEVARLHAVGVVEVRWLTSWDSDLLRDWKNVGLDFPSTERPSTGRRRWWKANAVEQWMAATPRRRAVWADDDLTPGRLRGFDRARLLAVTPHPSVGLTLQHLARIERWATRPESS